MKTYAKSLMLKKALTLFAGVLFCFPAQLLKDWKPQTVLRDNCRCESTAVEKRRSWKSIFLPQCLPFPEETGKCAGLRKEDLPSLWTVREKSPQNEKPERILSPFLFLLLPLSQQNVGHSPFLPPALPGYQNSRLPFITRLTLALAVPGSQAAGPILRVPSVTWCSDFCAWNITSILGYILEVAHSRTSCLS